MKRTRASRIGKLIGTWLGTAVSVASGYVWATNGILWASALWFGSIVVMFAAYGALTYPWRKGETT